MMLGVFLSAVLSEVSNKFCLPEARFWLCFIF
jgi:hypothetical protein